MELLWRNIEICIKTAPTCFGKFKKKNPGGTIIIFYLHIPSGRTVALGLPQPLREMRIFPGG
jgi:hypothetical protein